MDDIVERRRWLADLTEAQNPPKPGEWNIPQILRDDADEIERLREALTSIKAQCEIEMAGDRNSAFQYIAELATDEQSDQS